MKQIAIISVIVAVVSLVVGIISRLTLRPINGIEAQAFLRLSQTLLLLAIALVLLEKK